MAGAPVGFDAIPNAVRSFEGRRRGTGASAATARSVPPRRSSLREITEPAWRSSPFGGKNSIGFPFNDWGQLGIRWGPKLGYRDGETHKVNFTTFYVQLYGKVPDDQTAPLPGEIGHLTAADFVTILPTERIVSYRLFDVAAYIEFQKATTLPADTSANGTTADIEQGVAEVTPAPPG